MYSGWRTVTSGSWRAPVCELGVLGLLAAGLFAWLADEERRVPTLSEPPDTASPHAAAPVRLFPSRTLWAFFLGASLALSLRDFAGGALSTSASLFLQNAHGFGPKFAGLALSGIFLASAISNPVFGSLSDKGRMRWGTFLLLSAAVLVSVFPRVPVPWMSPVLLAYGFFFLATYPITEAALMDAVPDAVRSRIFGLFITVAGLVGNLSHWLVGGWIKRLGVDASLTDNYLPLYGVLSFMIILSVTGLPLLHALRRREHLTEDPSGVAPLSTLHNLDAP
jgi:MFS family permease